LFNAESNTGNELLSNIPIRLFITGDLAFYATMQGRENADWHYCMWCKLKKAAWQRCKHPSGPRFNIEELNAGGDCFLGIKEALILTHVKIERYVVPVLHLQLGLTNWIMKDFFDYWMPIWRSYMMNFKKPATSQLR
jgi:hypothetical protein